MQNNNLPEGYKVVDLHELPEEKQQELMTQVFELLHKNYGSFAQSESQEKWEDRLYAPGKEGTTLLVSAVVGRNGDVAAFSAAERYDEKIGKGATLITYTCADAENQSEKYPAFLKASKEGVLNSIEDLQKSGVAINGVFQEHKIGKETHAPKIAAGYELGQIPLSSPSTPTPYTDYTIPVYTADVNKDTDVATAVSQAAKANKADLFIANIMPSDPSMSLREIVENFRDGYVDNLSFFKNDPNIDDAIGFQPEQDPGYQALTRYAESLHPTMTYSEVYDAAKTDAAKFLGQPAQTQENYVQLRSTPVATAGAAP